MKRVPEERAISWTGLQHQWSLLRDRVRTGLLAVVVKFAFNGVPIKLLSPQVTLVAAKADQGINLLESLERHIRLSHLDHIMVLLDTIETLIKFKGEFSGVNQMRFMALRLEARQVLFRAAYESFHNYIRAERFDSAQKALNRMLSLLVSIQVEDAGVVQDLLPLAEEAELTLCWSHVPSMLGKLKQKLMCGQQIHESELTSIEQSLRRALALRVNVFPFYQELNALRKRAQGIGPMAVNSAS